MWENAHQNNSENGHFSRSDCLQKNISHIVFENYKLNIVRAVRNLLKIYIYKYSNIPSCMNIYYFKGVKNNLNTSFIMLNNGQTYFKNLAVSTPPENVRKPQVQTSQDFEVCWAVFQRFE